MQCKYCGKKLLNVPNISEKKQFCNEKCKKIYDFYKLEDLILKFCNKFGNYCTICPIEKECSLFRKIEKLIRSDEDILKYDIPRSNKII
ncbi:MAG: hypothetical protein ACFFDN_37175 [Candidatus Hodarchaeota archaeon]